MTNETKKPTAALRIGRLEATIWPNETQKGRFYKTRINHTYKDGEDLKTTTSYDLADLPIVARLSDWATNKIIQLENA